MEIDIPKLFRARIWAGANEAIHVSGSPLAPPYLALLVLNPDGDIRRLRLHAVHWNGRNSPTIIASQNERIQAALLHARGATVFKPLRPEAFGEFMHRLGLVAPEQEMPPYEPDFIFWDPARPGVPTVCEVVGYGVDGHHDYHAHLAVKERFYRRPGSPWRYERVDATDLPRDRVIPEPTATEVDGNEITAGARAAILVGLTLFAAPIT